MLNQLDPGFTDVEEGVQIKTLLPVIDFIKNNYKIPISIDTRSSKVAMAFEEHDIDFINDVSSGFHDSNMLDTVAKLGCAFIMTHIPRSIKRAK